MSIPPATLLTELRACTDAMVTALTEIAQIETPTEDKAGLDRLGNLLAGQYADLGGQASVISQTEAGNHLAIRWPGEEGQVLLLGHMDTVWPVGTLEIFPVTRNEDRLRGPGVFDMKASFITTRFALQTLFAHGWRPRRTLTLLCTSDEETGSRTSREWIEAEAKKSAVVLCLEPAHPPLGALKTWRKGTGWFTVRAIGKAAHAGAKPEEGISATEEIAHQILRLHAMNNPQTGTQVNVGVIGGGTRNNVVAAEAWAKVDLRVMTLAEGEQVIAAVQGLQPVLPGARLEITGGLNRPPMERTPPIVALYEKARDLGRQIGLEIPETGTGGASDGNFTAALGIPTLDGLGAEGDGGHALSEHVLIKSLPERATLLALLLQDLAG